MSSPTDWAWQDVRRLRRQLAHDSLSAKPVGCTGAVVLAPDREPMAMRRCLARLGSQASSDAIRVVCDPAAAPLDHPGDLRVVRSPVEAGSGINLLAGLVDLLVMRPCCRVVVGGTGGLGMFAADSHALLTLYASRTPQLLRLLLFCYEGGPGSELAERLYEAQLGIGSLDLLEHILPYGAELRLEPLRSRPRLQRSGVLGAALRPLRPTPLLPATVATNP